MQVTGIVQYVNEPKPGKKKGSIKLDDGNYYGVWPDKLHLFTKGQRVTFDASESEYQGKTFYNFEGMAQNQPEQPEQPAQPSRGGTKPEEMFIMSVVGRSMGSGKFNIHDIPDLAQSAWNAWAMLYGGEIKPQVKKMETDLNDDIPF